MRIFLLWLAFIGLCRALSFGNPADVPPRGSFEASVEFSKQFIFTNPPPANFPFSTTNWPPTEHTSYRLALRLSYSLYNWLELYFYGGGADINPDIRITPTQTAGWNGRWELFPGAGVKMKTPLDVTWLDMRWYIFADAKYVFIRSTFSNFVLGIWNWGGECHFNELEGAAFLACKTRRRRFTYYAGIALRFVMSSVRVTATSTISLPPTAPTVWRWSGIYGVTSTANCPPGTWCVLPIRKGIMPVLGVNWHVGNNYTLSFEANVCDISGNGPKVGFTFGLSQYR